MIARKFLLNLFFLLATLLWACSSYRGETPIPTILTSETAIPAFTRTPIPTSTQTPTPTPTETVSPTPTRTPIPTPLGPSPNQVIYFSILREQNEIWQLRRDGSPASLIYSGAQRFITLGEGVQEGYIGLEAEKELREKYERDPDPSLASANEISLEVSMFGLHLSPNKDLLAWGESFDYCPGNYCLGQNKISVMQTSDQTLISEFSTSWYMTELIWSPDGQYFAFSIISRGFDLIPPQLWIFDANSWEFSKVGEGFYGSWSADSQYIVVTYTDNPRGWGIYEMRILSITDGDFITFETPGWEHTGAPSLSPDGNQLAFIGAKGESNAILMLDLRSDEITDLWGKNDNSVWGSIDWSVNGKFLTATRSDGSFSQEILIIDPTNSEFSYGIASSSYVWAGYEWSPNGQWILVMTPNQANGYIPDLVIVDPRTGEQPIYIEEVSPSWGWSDDSQEILFIDETTIDAEPVPEIHLSFKVANVFTREITTLEIGELLEEYLQTWYQFILVTW